LNSFNLKQKIVVWVGVAIVLLMGIVPPWKHQIRISEKVTFEPAGYGFIFSPPKPKAHQGAPNRPYIQFSRLLLQWALVAVIAGVIVNALKRKEDEEEPSILQEIDVSRLEPEKTEDWASQTMVQQIKRVKVETPPEEEKAETKTRSKLDQTTRLMLDHYSKKR